MNPLARLTKCLRVLLVSAVLCTGGGAFAGTLHDGANSGSLSSSDGTSATRSGRYADVWTFTLPQRTDVTISMASSFDNYLILYSGSTPSSSSKITHDDDSGPGVNAEIWWTLDAGTYSIEATSYSSGDTGSYTLDADLGGGGGGCHSDPLGDWDYCSSSCPCSAGEGDCDPGYGECASGLICVDNVGADYGFRGSVDVCLPDIGGLLGSNILELCALALEQMVGRQELERRYTYENTKYLAFFGVSAFNMVGVKMFVDLNDYLGLTPEGRDGYVTVWVDVSAGPSFGLPFSFGVTASDFSTRDQDASHTSSSFSLMVPTLEVTALETTPDGRNLLGHTRSASFGASIGGSFTGSLVVEMEKTQLDLAVDQASFMYDPGAVIRLSDHAWDLLHNLLNLDFSLDWPVCIPASPSDDAPGWPCGGAQPGDWDYCSSSSPCAAGEGDCDPGQNECAPGLVCVEDVGASYGWASGVDVCEEDIQPGGWDYCSSSSPCADGEGDCDNDSECGPGLVCVNNVGASYGWASGVDVCEGSSLPGDWDYCSSSSPCADGEGDCDNNSECGPGLVCVNNVGASYGWASGVDVCEGGSQPGDWDYCSSSWRCAAGEGDCDGNSECDPGLVCVWNVGASYGFGSNVDVCEAP